MTIDGALREATGRLLESPTPRLDAEVLLAHVCEHSRTWLYTWSDRALTADQFACFDALIERRSEGWPVAYLTGSREFWGLDLQTSPATLIPRPDTERLVEVALESASAVSGKLLDLGTGTGAVALALASERRDWQVTGVDLAPEAVTLAQSNARKLAISNVNFLLSDWFSALSGRRFDIIVANPPYIADDDPHLTRDDVRFEPRSALVAEAAGLSDLAWLARHAPSHLEPEGWLWLEHGYAQAGQVQDILVRCGFVSVVSRQDLAGHERITGGQWPG
ncbi:peptide chain release factor N(5)-glutamine methyltransferase [Salinicola halimionae]|uniref:peptide chain release factor N(5)-glutamine methyltransferase n=1 Tax=Salinicola halimionae TaxID=1949081 RepID=UPI000DA154E7|nr:peptide chain release factor N(5)-glutamine methyltransferase [Salinicola halimionae]